MTRRNSKWADDPRLNPGSSWDDYEGGVASEHPLGVVKGALIGFVFGMFVWATVALGAYVILVVNK